MFKMEKLISIILLLIFLLSVTSCSKTGAEINIDVNTNESEVTSDTTVLTDEITQPYVNTPNEQGIIRVDGVMMHYHNLPYVRYMPVPLGYCFNGLIGPYVHLEKGIRIINGYSELKAVFEGALRWRSVDVKAEDVFKEDLFEENFIILFKNAGYGLNFAWFDCQFLAETNELSVTPVRKYVFPDLYSQEAEFVLDPQSYFVIVPRSFLPEGYDIMSLKPVINRSVTLAESSMPNPLEAGGSITVVFELNLEDNYHDLLKKYKGTDDKYEKVHSEIYNENMEYLKNINLECPNFTVSQVSRFVFVHFENRMEFMPYKDYFEALKNSEYIKQFAIT